MIREAEIESTIRAFIEDNFLYRTEQAQLSDSESLLEAGLVIRLAFLNL